MSNNLLQKIFFIQKIIDEKEFTRININLLGLKIKFKALNKIENCVAIVDCGGIGDYMICRPYFKYLKESPKFKDCNFIYLCKDAYQDMVKTYDNDVFKDVITYDEDYKATKKALKKFKIHTLINLFSLSRGNNFRGWLTRHNLIKNLKIKRKIADVTIETNDDLKNPNLKIFNEFIVTKNKPFELERRRQFFEKVAETSIPHISKQITPIIDFSKEYICISLFTGYKKRNYDESKWIEVLNYLIENISQDTQLLFLGSNNDKNNIQQILNKLNNSSHCINFAGISNISLVPSILKNAKLLIALETGTVHIAESVNCPTICISCGAHYGRFLPYNNQNISYVFPDKFEDLLIEKNKDILDTFYQANWTYKVKDIPSEKIIKEIDKFLSSAPHQALVNAERV